MNKNLEKILERIIEEEKLTKEFSEYDSMDDMYKYCTELGGGYTEEEFDEGIAQTIDALRFKERETLLSDEDLDYIAGGINLNGMFSKTAAVMLTALTMGSAILPFNAKSAEISQNLGGTQIVSNVKAENTGKWSKTKEALSNFWKEHKKKIIIGTAVTLAAVAVAGATVWAYNHKEAQRLRAAESLRTEVLDEAEQQTEASVEELTFPSVLQEAFHNEEDIPVKGRSISGSRLDELWQGREEEYKRELAAKKAEREAEKKRQEAIRLQEEEAEREAIKKREEEALKRNQAIREEFEAIKEAERLEKEKKEAERQQEDQRRADRHKELEEKRKLHAEKEKQLEAERKSREEAERQEAERQKAEKARRKQSEIEVKRKADEEAKRQEEREAQEAQENTISKLREGIDEIAEIEQAVKTICGEAQKPSATGKINSLIQANLDQVNGRRRQAEEIQQKGTSQTHERTQSDLSRHRLKLAKDRRKRIEESRRR